MSLYATTRVFAINCFNCRFLAFLACLAIPYVYSYGQANPTQTPLPFTIACSTTRIDGAITIRATLTPTPNESAMKRIIFGFGSPDAKLIVQGDSATLYTASITKTSGSINVGCSATLDGQTAQGSIPIDVVPAIPSTLIVKGFDIGGTLAPTLSWTTGTQTQTIAGGSALISAVRSTAYCDNHALQFGLAANASDTSTTKTTGPTINLDNNDVRADVTSGIWAFDAAHSHFGGNVDFFGNNSLGLGLQQTYTAEYQYHFDDCGKGAPSAISQNDRRWFAALGIGAGFMSQRLYATQNKLNTAVLPISAQFSYLSKNGKGIPPKLLWFGSLEYLPVLNVPRAYQLSAIAALQIPTQYRWLTVTLTESDLYMNNAPSGFKRNYQNGSVALAFTFPKPPKKIENPALPPSDTGACYSPDKLSRLYCYDEVTADACAPPNLFRRKQVCSSASGVNLLKTQEQ